MVGRDGNAEGRPSAATGEEGSSPNPEPLAIQNQQDPIQKLRCPSLKQWVVRSLLHSTTTFGIRRSKSGSN